MGWACVRNWDSEELVVSTDRIQEPFAFRCSISNGVGYAIEVGYQGEDRENMKYELPEHPVLNIPPIVAPGAGSIYINGY